jgi:hypothetical protein
VRLSYVANVSGAFWTSCLRLTFARYLIAITYGIPSYPVKNYLQLSFKELGFSTVNANLLSVPTCVISVIMIIFITVLSELVDNRSFVSMAENIVSSL